MNVFCSLLRIVSLKNNILGECFTGYQGILRADCKVGFSRTWGYNWDKCPNPIWTIIILILMFIVVIIGIAIIIRSTFAGALQKK